jgi:hypothetical protein
MQHSTEAINDYDSHPEKTKLKPGADIFFIVTNRGILNNGLDFLEPVRNGQIHVHIADMARLSDHIVYLSTGDTLSADVLMCGTEWQDTHQLDFVTGREFGLPGHDSLPTKKYSSEADAEMFQNCPKLQHPPSLRHCKPITEDKTSSTPGPYQLYRLMVPPDSGGSHTRICGRKPKSYHEHYRAITSTLDFGLS